MKWYIIARILLLINFQMSDFMWNSEQCMRAQARLSSSRRDFLSYTTSAYTFSIYSFLHTLHKNFHN